MRMSDSRLRSRRQISSAITTTTATAAASSAFFSGCTMRPCGGAAPKQGRKSCWHSKHLPKIMRQSAQRNATPHQRAKGLGKPSAFFFFFLRRLRNRRLSGAKSTQHKLLLCIANRARSRGEPPVTQPSPVSQSQRKARSPGNTQKSAMGVARKRFKCSSADKREEL